MKRSLKKFEKIKNRRGIFFAILFIFFYSIRRAILHFFLLFLKNKNSIDKKILFIEPVNQGYGDTFFQTALFDSLRKKGYFVHILTNSNHSQVLENNPNVYKIYFWNLKSLMKNPAAEQTRYQRQESEIQILSDAEHRGIGNKDY